MDWNNVLLMGYKVYADDLSKLDVRRPKVINTLNGHSYTVGKKDNEFRMALIDSDILLPDGISIVFGVKLLSGVTIRKIAGFDLFMHYMKMLSSNEGSCFFLGSSESTLDRIVSKIKLDFPGVTVGFLSPPFKDTFSKEDNFNMRKVINDFNPDVLFVGMTAPKQEKWVQQNKSYLSANVICSIGAVFDFYAGTKLRPHPILIKMKLEWLGRLYKEPQRMWRRYLVSTPVFFIDIFFAKLKALKSNYLGLILSLLLFV